MRQAQRKKEKDKIAVALMLAFCVIALTSVFTIKSNIDKINGSGGDVAVSDQAPVNQKDAPPAEENPSVLDPDADPVSNQIPVVDSAAENQQAPETSTFINPVRSNDAYVTNEFSMDYLIYSVTLDQYMTHCGIDIEAPEDTQVVAMAPGTITAVYEDDRYGTSVEITHDDGMITIYSNLSTSDMVEIGD
ncbi:MAG: M23 family metallopeptidase, partial [Firmicutes bacterium]|nr:M23 family metallopeptidase [Bacillota bacterium]